MGKKFERILVSDYELTVIYEDEKLGINREGRTTVDFLDVYRCEEVIYNLGDDEHSGTRLILGDNSDIIVKEKYKEVETLRRAMKAEVIQAQRVIKTDE